MSSTNQTSLGLNMWEASDKPYYILLYSNYDCQW
ncbi:MAG: hypothetical protein PWP53_3986 [Lacrimispora sp.]|nr:hypothetical protein [Lacrimispora sp.]